MSSCVVLEECLCCFDMLLGLSDRGCPNSSRHVTATFHGTTKTKAGLALDKKTAMSCILDYEMLCFMMLTTQELYI